jgi:hypothetical protein
VTFPHQLSARPWCSAMVFRHLIRPPARFPHHCASDTIAHPPCHSFLALLLLSRHGSPAPSLPARLTVHRSPSRSFLARSLHRRPAVHRPPRCTSPTYLARRPHCRFTSVMISTCYSLNMIHYLLVLHELCSPYRLSCYKHHS